MTNTQASEYKGIKKGTRIKLTYTNDKYTDLSKLDYIGTVESINFCNFDHGFYQIWVNWDHGSHFAIVPETGDKWEILK